MKAGTHIQLPDGRKGTVVYNGLDGVGIKWGIHHITLEDIQGTGGVFGGEPEGEYQWFADAMLREPYPGAETPCVGSDYEVIEEAA